MTTGNKQTLATTWTENGTTYTPTSNDGTGLTYYTQWPSPATSDTIVCVLQTGQAGYRVNTGDDWDIVARGAGLLGVGSDPSTVNFETSFGGILDEDALDNFLNDAGQIYIRYTTSDLWVGAGSATHKNSNTNVTYPYLGHWAIRALVKEITGLSAAQDYSKILFVGWGASGWGLLMQWPWLHDYVVSRGFTPYGILDGMLPVDVTPYSGIDKFFTAETNAMRQYWRVNDQVRTAWDAVSLTADWTDTQADRFLIMSFQTNTERIEWYGIDITAISASESAWIDNLAATTYNNARRIRPGIHLYIPYKAPASATPPASYNRMTTSTWWADTTIVPELTPQEAVQNFLSGTPVHVVEPPGTFPTS